MEHLVVDWQDKLDIMGANQEVAQAENQAAEVAVATVEVAAEGRPHTHVVLIMAVQARKELS